MSDVRETNKLASAVAIELYHIQSALTKSWREQFNCVLSQHERKRTFVKSFYLIFFFHHETPPVEFVFLVVVDFNFYKNEKKNAKHQVLWVNTINPWVTQTSLQKLIYTIIFFQSKQKLQKLFCHHCISHKNIIFLFKKKAWSVHTKSKTVFKPKNKSYPAFIPTGKIKHLKV